MSIIIGRIWRRKLFSRTFSQFCIPQKNFSTSTNPHYHAQPTANTHPHLLIENEITPGLTTNIYLSRRENVIKLISDTSQMSLKEGSPAHLVVIPSSTVVHMSENIPYQFRQNTDFLYLSGFKETNCVLVLCAKIEKSVFEYETIMFLTKGSTHSDRWEGKRMDLRAAKDFLKIDKADYIEDLQKFLHSFALSNKKITVWYNYLLSNASPIHQTMQDFISSHNQVSVESLRSIMHKIRLIKSEPEAQLMRTVCRITADSMKEVIKFSEPSILESHLHAKIDYECRIRGADYLAFPPVVAGGDRANIIHYVGNNQRIFDGEMVLMDAGCEYHGYTSDMARTWPVSGKFSNPQKEIYELVLNVQEQLIKLCEKRLPLDYLFKIMCKLMGHELQKLGLIPSNATKDELLEAVMEFCPHHVSHYLGMDVHDTKLISCGINLQPGMVITVEPGIYISSNDTRVPPKYRGICVRIEDDVLITEDGYEVLTANCPKHINEIENIFVS